MKRSLFAALVVSLFACLILGAHPARALTLNVPCDPAALPVAINIANDISGSDTLNLSPGCPYYYSSPDPVNNDSILPRITSVMTINGNGALIARIGGPQARLLYLEDAEGNLTLNDVTLFGGDSSGDGGAIYNGGWLTVNGSTITGNRAVLGGGIFGQWLSVTVVDSIITGNTATSDGGGLIIANGSLTMMNSTVSGNVSLSNGGGLFNWATMTLIGSTISNNTGISGGGIQNNGMLRMINSTISGNSATGGGGIHNQFANLTMSNSIVSGNRASGNHGGGIFNYFSDLTVTNTIIAGNSASHLGGGIRHDNGTATLTNSIVWGNNSQISGIPTVTYSDIEGGFAGTGNIDADPLFVAPVAHASAPTTSGDYRLQAGSPALNVGSNAALPADTLDLDGDSNTAEPIPYDRDGHTRVINGIVDMGAYEHQTVLAQEMLDNGDFETNLVRDNLPDGWTLKNGSGDKLSCKPGKPLNGLCAFAFKGGANEKAALSQSIDLTGVTVDAGDTLTLSAWFLGNNPSAKIKVELSITYTGNPTPAKTKLTVKRNAAYTMHTMPVVNATGPVEAIKVTFKHASTAGSILIDDASLIHTPGSGRMRADAPLPPPAAPSGFRGGN